MGLMGLDLSKEPAALEADPAEYVGFWPRFAARGLDTIIHFLIVLVASILGGILIVIVQSTTGRSIQESLQALHEARLTNFVFSFFGIVFYGTIFESLHGSTLGKRLLGFVVLHEDKSPCRFLAAAGRQLAFVVDSILFGLVGFYAMGGNRREQRYGDQWCRTIVIRRRSAPPGAVRSDLRFMGVFLLAFGVDASLLLIPFCLAGAG